MDLTKFSLPELKQLLAQIPKEIERRQKEEKAKLRKELEAKAAELGFTLEELIAGNSAKKERAPVAVKYRHPSETGLTWSGRGRQPKWLAEFVEKGGKLEQLKV